MIEKLELDADTRTAWISALDKGFGSNCTEENGLNLKIAYEYMAQKNDDALNELWLRAFLGEASTAYDGESPDSCTSGIQERALLALRVVMVALYDSDDSEFKTAMLKFFAAADLVKSYDGKEKFCTLFTRNPSFRVTWPESGELSDEKKKQSWLTNVRTHLEDEARKAGLDAEQTVLFINSLNLQIYANHIEWYDVKNPSSCPKPGKGSGGAGPA